MAAIDYTTLAVDGNGRMVKRLEIVPGLSATAYKSLLILSEGDKEVYFGSYDPLYVLKLLPSFKDGHDIVLEDDTEDCSPLHWKAGAIARALRRSGLVKGHEKKLAKVLRKALLKCEKKQDGLMRVLHFEADEHRSTVFFFPDSPHFGGLSCAYFLDDDGAISLILSGYGHYGNPALHWIGRGLTDKAEAEIARRECDEMIRAGALIRLIAPLGYEDRAYERCGDGLLLGLSGDEKMMEDADFDRLYQAVKKAGSTS